MSLLDKIAAMQNEPDNRDLLEYFGVVGSEFVIADGMVTVGPETVSLEDACRALYRPTEPVRTVVIGDLDGA